MNDKRIIFIDFIKGVAITCVVLLHIDYNFYNSSLFNIKSLLGGLWHVPVFFVVSGYFLSEQKLSKPLDFVKKKINPLYLKPLYLYLIVSACHNLFVKMGWVYEGAVEWSFKEYIMVLIKNICMLAREDLCGAMWYVDSLLIGLITFSCLTYLINKIITSNSERIILRFIIIFTFACISNILTNKYNVTIPRISNSLSALLLLQIGQLIGQVFNPKYNNLSALIFSIIIVSYYVVTDGSIALNNNRYSNIPQLVLSSVSVFYILAFIGNKFKKTKIIHLFSYCGSYSFWIMGLHFIAFKMCTSILAILHIDIIPGRYLTTPPLRSDVVLLFVYLIVGLLLPIVMIKVWNWLYFNLFKMVTK